jgi:hypothetical protein
MGRTQEEEMSMTALFLNGLLASAAAATLGVAGSAWAAGDEKLQAELRTLAQRRVFFGHQSVGVNLMDGLRQLAARYDVNFRIVETRSPAGVPTATFGHGFVAANGNPRLKLQSFHRAFESGAAAGAEIGLLKFCYVDFKADTDVAALFAEYQATIVQLRAQHPATTFVHVTAPLTTVPGGIKASLKQLLGRAAPRDVLENARREEYNALLRKAYQGREPIFDLARVEATRPDGSVEAQEWQGRMIPSLVESYSDDGGHLNGEGQLRAARELVSVLAGLPPSPTDVTKKAN